MNEANDNDIDENMDLFEAASSAHSINLPEISLDHILLAEDGSNQDDLARQIAVHFQADIVTPDSLSSGQPHRQILSSCHDADCGLIVVPAPFREEFEELGATSIGSNLDRLLAERSTPVLVVRDPEREAKILFQEIILPLSFVAAEDIRAAAWAFRALAPGGRIRLLAIVDTERIIGSRKLEDGALDLDDLDEKDLAGLDQPEMAGLVAAVQRHAAKANVGCRVSIRVGATVSATTKFANDQSCLLVITCPPDHTAPCYTNVHSLVRQSLNPVLIV